MVWAACTDLTDLTVEDLAAYLPRTERIAASGGRGDVRVWDSFLERPRARDTPASMRLGHVLGTPLMVALARTMYEVPGKHPLELFDTARRLFPPHAGSTTPSGSVGLAPLGLVFSLTAGLAFGLVAAFEAPMDTAAAATPMQLLSANRTAAIRKLLAIIPAVTIGCALAGRLAVRLIPKVLPLNMTWTWELTFYLGIIGGLGGSTAYILAFTAWGQWLTLARIWLPLTRRLPWGIAASWKAPTTSAYCATPAPSTSSGTTSSSDTSPAPTSAPNTQQRLLAALGGAVGESKPPMCRGHPVLLGVEEGRATVRSDLDLPTRHR
ncbi:hypothetical protein [Streptomyces sp. NPDC048057]|uniref:hypothetical protein n=1 Tax=Streptomyces sp. NPDC048057 TaxID=3155628 RepID=UPI0033E2D703